MDRKNPAKRSTRRPAQNERSDYATFGALPAFATPNLHQLLHGLAQTLAANQDDSYWTNALFGNGAAGASGGGGWTTQPDVNTTPVWTPSQGGSFQEWLREYGQKRGR